MQNVKKKMRSVGSFFHGSKKSKGLARSLSMPSNFEDRDFKNKQNGLLKISSNGNLEATCMKENHISSSLSSSDGGLENETTGNIKIPFRNGSRKNKNKEKLLPNASSLQSVPWTTQSLPKDFRTKNKNVPLEVFNEADEWDTDRACVTKKKLYFNLGTVSCEIQSAYSEINLNEVINNENVARNYTESKLRRYVSDASTQNQVRKCLVPITPVEQKKHVIPKEPFDFYQVAFASKPEAQKPNKMLDQTDVNNNNITDKNSYMALNHYSTKLRHFQEIATDVRPMTIDLPDINSTYSARPLRKSQSLIIKKTNFIHPRRRQSDTDIPLPHALNTCELKLLVEYELQRLLKNKTYIEDMVTKWSKEISNQIRDKIIDLEKQMKIVINTFIAPKLENNNIHVSTCSQTDREKDRFLVIAFEGQDLYVWVTLCLLTC